MKWIRRGIALVFGLAVVAALVFAFMPKPASVETARVVRGAMLVSIDAQGQTRVKNRFTVSSPQAGNLERIVLKAGDPVQTGAALATVKSLPAPLLDARMRPQAVAALQVAEAQKRQAESTLVSAKAALEFAEWKAGQDRSLRKAGSVSEEALRLSELRFVSAIEDQKSAQFGVQVAEFQVQQAKVALLQTGQLVGGDALVIRSPVSGRVLRVWQESESSVMPGTALLEIGDPGSLEVVADMLSTDSVRIATGSPVIIDHWGGEGSLAGRVRLIEPSGFTKVSALGVEEQRVNVVIEFSEAREKFAALGDAYRVEVRVVIWQRENILKVPGSVLFRSGDGWALFLADSGRAVKREVLVGRRNGLEAEITRGVEEGESVIIHPGDAVKDGAAVSTK